MENKKKREVLPDLLRGFAIILVVLGHCIQEGSGAAVQMEQLYFCDRLYQWIYSFHMPLFMIVSGYLNWKSIKQSTESRELFSLMKRRLVSLIIPIFLWTGVDYIRILLLNALNRNAQPEALIFVYFYNALHKLWFLWAVWWCFLLVCVVHYIFRDHVLVYVFGFLLLFVIPDGLGLGAYKYMMPYFLFGYYSHDLMKWKQWKLDFKPKIWIILITGLAFAVLFVYYNESFLIYTTGYKLVGKQVTRQLWIDFYRMLIGFAGSFFFILVWQYLAVSCSKFQGMSILRQLGADSMGIYILSEYLVIFLVQRFAWNKQPSYILNVFEAVVVLAASWMGTMILGKIPVLKQFVGKE
ncbi:MAG: acyltransferase [Lachnospiraceae bacterium]|nr:acyltransferase [Lachnospiraceae bacterium]